jgi:hypothetical protein
MSTGFTCERCGSRWGVLTVLRYDPRKELMRACFEGRCDVKAMAVFALKRWSDRRLTVV